MKAEACSLLDAPELGYARNNTTKNSKRRFLGFYKEVFSRAMHASRNANMGLRF